MVCGQLKSNKLCGQLGLKISVELAVWYNVSITLDSFQVLSSHFAISDLVMILAQHRRLNAHNHLPSPQVEHNLLPLPQTVHNPLQLPQTEHNLQLSLQTVHNPLPWPRIALNLRYHRQVVERHKITPNIHRRHKITPPQENWRCRRTPKVHLVNHDLNKVKG